MVIGLQTGCYIDTTSKCEFGHGLGRSVHVYKYLLSFDKLYDKF